MPLEFTSLPPAPRGMNLTAPAIFIDDMYCRWMQDVLVDRPGQIRMRGPLQYWYSEEGIGANESVLGATEHYTADNNWRGAVFVASGVSEDGNFNSDPGKIYVYSNENSTPGLIDANGITLPFVLKTKYDTTTNRWINNTIIDCKPALKDGVWITIFDDVTNDNVAGNAAALLYWRGAGKATIDIGNGTNDAEISADSRNIVHVSSVAASVEPGMFAFNTADGRYLGCVSSIDDETVTLEKEVLYEADLGSTNNLTIRYMSFRGFVHQYGRGVASADSNGAYLTSGRLGSDFEGFFDAARVTIGDSHNAIVYRQSDHKYVAKIENNGTKSNTQVALDNTSAADNLLRDESYFIIRNDGDLYTAASNYDSLKHPMDLNYRRPDMRPKTYTLTNNTEVAAAHPGLFNATYAGRQWFASFNSNDPSFDGFINRVVFSSADNPENINLCQDASDSIMIPGKEPIRAIAGSNSGLLVFVESKTYIIKGTNRQNFALEELYPDGTLCATSVVQVGGGVIWAGKQGIYYYDGVTVRNFTQETLGIYYTDGIKNFNVAKDRIYAFINNNYLVINFTNWYSSYSLKRWEAQEKIDLASISGITFPPNPNDNDFFYNTETSIMWAYSGIDDAWTNLGNFGPDEIVKITNTGDYTLLNPTCITFCIYLPTGAIGTLSNFSPRGYMRDIIVMNDNVDNSAKLLDMRSIFTENVDDFDTDVIVTNDAMVTSTGLKFAGPDFYIETKQYNFGEFTLRKWWRKLMFTLSINKGYLMVEFVDNNDNSLVSPTTGTDDLFCNADESGFFLIPPTTQKWKWYEENNYYWSQIWTGSSFSPLDKSIQYVVGVLSATAPTYDGSFQGWYDTDTDDLYMYDDDTDQWVLLTTSNGLYVGFRFFDYQNDDTYRWNGSSWENVGPTALTWEQVFKGSIIRFSRWLGFRQNSLGFRVYSLRNYYPSTGPGAEESTPEVININEWNFGLKPLRKGRN